jgi:hypothetical protein
MEGALAKCKHQNLLPDFQWESSEEAVVVEIRLFAGFCWWWYGRGVEKWEQRGCLLRFIHGRFWMDDLLCPFFDRFHRLWVLKINPGYI